MLQEKRISSKINYEVLKSLNVGAVENKPAPPPIPDDISFVTPKVVEIKETPVVTPRFEFIFFNFIDFLWIY